MVAPNGHAPGRIRYCQRIAGRPELQETSEITSAAGPGVTDDVVAVRYVLMASDEPIVVVAHSYGGIVVAEVATGSGSVHHLLFISSYLPEAGQSLSSFGGEDPTEFLDVVPTDRKFTVRPDRRVETFLQDCDPAIQPAAPDRTARQSLAVLEQAVHAAAGHHIPTTYPMCVKDTGTRPTDNKSSPVEP